jgi:hypothetical protein
MPLLKDITAPNGASVGFHKAMQVNYDPVGGTVAVNVASWVDEDAHNAGGNLAWMWPIAATPSALSDLDSALASIAPFDGAAVVSDESQSLAAVQIRQCALLDAAYARAIAADVSFTTAAGDTRMYQADPQSVSDLSSCLLGFQAAQAVPEGYFWQSKDNTRVTPFTYADLQGLAAALANHGFAAFAQLQDLKAAVRAATTTDAVRAITWP